MQLPGLGANLGAHKKRLEPMTETRLMSEDFDAEEVRAVARAGAAAQGPLLPILHAVRERFGFIDDRAIPVIADVLNLSRAEVHGVVSFYHDFRRAPAGRHVIKLCRAEACQAMGCERVVADLEKAGLTMNGTTGDGAVTLEAVYCLGNCALSPAALVNGELHGRVDAAAALQLVGRK